MKFTISDFEFTILQSATDGKFAISAEYKDQEYTCTTSLDPVGARGFAALTRFIESADTEKRATLTGDTVLLVLKNYMINDIKIGMKKKDQSEVEVLERRIVRLTKQIHVLENPVDPITVSYSCCDRKFYVSDPGLEKMIIDRFLDRKFLTSISAANVLTDSLYFDLAGEKNINSFFSKLNLQMSPGAFATNFLSEFKKYKITEVKLFRCITHNWNPGYARPDHPNFRAAPGGADMFHINWTICLVPAVIKKSICIRPFDPKVLYTGNLLFHVPYYTSNVDLDYEVIQE